MFTIIYFFYSNTVHSASWGYPEGYLCNITWSKIDPDANPSFSFTHVINRYFYVIDSKTKKMKYNFSILFDMENDTCVVGSLADNHMEL